VTKEPSSPAVIDEPSSPDVIEEPSSLVVIKEPSSPIVMEETESYTKTTIGQETTVTKDKCVKVLGVLWDTENDTFAFEFSGLVQYTRSLPATKWEHRSKTRSFKIEGGAGKGTNDSPPRTVTCEYFSKINRHSAKVSI
jgi:hypothetical protein